MKSIIKTAFLAILLLASLAIVPSSGQTERIYEKFEPTEEFLAAFHSGEKGDFNKTAARFAELAARHPGTTLGAESLFMAAQFSLTSEQVRGYYNAVIAGYPRSRFEVCARVGLVNVQYNHLDRPDPNGWLLAADQLAASYGAPTLGELLRGGPAAALRRVQALSLELQEGLYTLYDEMHNLLADRLDRFDDAIAVAIFMRQAFFHLGIDPDFTPGYVENDLMMKKFGQLRGYDYKRVDPRIRILGPKPNQSKGPRPKIRIETTVGDYTCAQVDLSGVHLRLDGQDVTSRVSVRSKFRRGLGTKAHSVFERLRFRYRPTEPLAPGTHQVSITVPTQSYTGSGPGLASSSWSFKVVARRSDDPEDECADDDEDKDGWERQDD